MKQRTLKYEHNKTFTQYSSEITSNIQRFKLVASVIIIQPSFDKYFIYSGVDMEQGIYRSHKLQTFSIAIGLKY